MQASNRRKNHRAITVSPRTPRIVPRWLFVPAGLGIIFLLLPIIGLISQISWSNFPALIFADTAIDALRLSICTSATATAIVVAIGIPLSMILAWTDFPGKKLLRALLLLPLVLPPVVSGIALLQAFGRRGLIGSQFEAFGIEIAFTTVAVVISQVFISLPFMVVTLEGALNTAGRSYQTVAMSLGASPTRTLWRVSVPMMTPAIMSGGILAFARSLGEFGATSIFAGSRQGVTRTLPVEIYLQREIDPDSAIALSLLLIISSIVIVGAVYGRVRK
ncbi:ABC transporter permease [Corynebacterium jeikeium]|uniref:ABC transporter permease n=1 Tax=Corynebacterium jeikeium TaxID=38289 RepID=UPI0006820FBF|nr:ABC transporter permease [Corynebacterium jeikeium]OOD30258.1 molybdenum ABC transporter permease subunit [Corynebacterium jeikeium]WCZ54248.1 Sulfate transport system permease protein CysT [Corynebacterium jeikeium]SQI20242.1 molybdate ABC transport system, permease [Corynebacterium jeikeium]SUY80446.1 molybdate ABC transport system, permease [Corynebacterium jeikeium]